MSSIDNSPIYFNCSQTNGVFGDPLSNINNQLSRFTCVSDDSIIYNPEQYYISLNRLKIHTESIPLYLFPIVPNQPDPDLSPFKITFSYTNAVGVVIATTTGSVIYQSQYIGYTPPSVSAAGQTFNNDDILLYYSVYNVSQMLKIFNDSINFIFQNFRTNCAGFGITIDDYPPYYIFDVNTLLFSLVFYKDYFDQSPTTAKPIIKMFQDNVGADLFNCPYSYIRSGLRPDPAAIVMMQAFNLFNNNIPTEDYFTMQASQNAFNIWCPVSRLVCYIDLPTKLEYDIVSTDQSFQAINSNNYTAKPQEPIFFDIMVDADTFAKTGNIIQYSVSSIAESRLVGLKSGPPIKNFTITILWKDIYNNNHNIVSYGNTSNLIKIVFYKKSSMLL